MPDQSSIRSITAICLCVYMTGAAVQAQQSPQTARGDYDGDGKSDLAVYDDVAGKWHIAYSNGGATGNGISWGGRGMKPLRGDFAGNGRNDIAVYNTNNGFWHVLGLGSVRVSDRVIINQRFGSSNVMPVAGDFNGDGKDDLAIFNPQSATWSILKPDRMFLKANWGYSGVQVVTGDYNGNGRTDLAVYDPNRSGAWYIRDTDGTQIAFDLKWGYRGTTAVSGDFDGDGISDLAVYDARNGTWHIRTMAGQTHHISWGYPGAVPVPGDYNGDGKTDLGVYDARNGTWHILTMAGDTFSISWGYPGTVPIPGDYNGDGKTDLAVYDVKNYVWHVRTVAGQALAVNRQWGFAGGIPSVTKFDDNDTDDLVIFDPKTAKWYIASLNQPVPLLNGKTAGQKGGLPLPGVYSGEGEAELATFLNGSWQIVQPGRTLRSGLQWGVVDGIPLAGRFFSANADDIVVFDPVNADWYIQAVAGRAAGSRKVIRHGYEGVIPVVGDFDGDQRSDLAVYDPNHQTWFIKNTEGYIIGNWGQYWGLEGHTPLAGDFSGNGKDDLVLYDGALGKWYAFQIDGGKVVFSDAKWGYRGAMAVGAPVLTEAWDGVHALPGRIPVFLPYNEDWVVEFDFIGMSVNTIWHYKFLESDPAGWTKFHMFRDNQGGLGFRLSNRRINLIADRIGTITRPVPPDHWGRTRAAVPIGTHSMRLEYSYSTRRFRIIWNDNVIGDFGMNILSLPSPITFMDVGRVDGGQLRYRVGPIQ